MSFRNYNHKIYTFTSNTTAMRNPNKNDREFQDDKRITAYSHGSNIQFINILMIKLYRIQFKN